MQPQYEDKLGIYWQNILKAQFFYSTLLKMGSDIEVCRRSVKINSIRIVSSFHQKRKQIFILKYFNSDGPNSQVFNCASIKIRISMLYMGKYCYQENHFSHMLELYSLENLTCIIIPKSGRHLHIDHKKSFFRSCSILMPR